jgi:hypothetical protein
MRMTSLVVGGPAIGNRKFPHPSMDGCHARGATLIIRPQFTIKLNVVLAEGLEASELLTLYAFTVTV